MARRIALARAIALDPMMIMYDEPFTGQDPISKGALVQLIRLLNDALGLTSIIVSHDVEETAAISDYIYVISQGKVVGSGTPEDLEKNGFGLGQAVYAGPAGRPGARSITRHPSTSTIC